MPKGVGNAYWFQVFNAASWSIVLGTPMLLYLKTLEAPAVALGVAVALTPLFGALQIPAANYVERIGYKISVVRGWTTRSVFILGVAAAALLPADIPVPVRIGLVLLMLACFAALRGISVCGYLPWITLLVPENKRGIYVSREIMCMYLALTATMLLSSGWVFLFDTHRSFGVLFMLSYLAALASLFFLKRIPDVAVEPRKAGPIHPPWKEMIFFKPFFRYLLFSLAANLFTSALGLLFVPFMKDIYKASGSYILVLSAYGNIVSVLAMSVIGRLADRTGSRPLLGFASVLIVASQVGWMALSAQALPGHPSVPFIIALFGAIGYPMMNLASVRLLMGTVPAIGRSHFFAISSVASSLTLGFMPILWGLALDGLGGLIGDEGVAVGLWTWNKYSLLYAIVLIGTLGAQFFRRRLDEPRSMDTDQFLRLLLIRTPGRIVYRVLAPIRRFMAPG